VALSTERLTLRPLCSGCFVVTGLGGGKGKGVTRRRNVERDKRGEGKERVTTEKRERQGFVFKVFEVERNIIDAVEQPLGGAIFAA